MKRSILLRRFVARFVHVAILSAVRGTTTAKLAALCKVRENVLYRIWPSKKAMFLDCIEHIYQVTMELWDELSQEDKNDRSLAERILDYQAEDHGLLRYYRIVFAGMLEEDPEIRKALRELYQRFHEFIKTTTNAHRVGSQSKSHLNADMTAWALMGTAAMVDIQRELGILATEDRANFLSSTGRRLLNGSSAASDQQL